MKPKQGIAVDAWCSKNPGRGGYKAIDIATGKKLFEWSCNYTTNNLVEFVAICHAMMWRDKYRPNEVIWSDSMTAIAWVKHKYAKTKVNYNKAPDLKHRVDLSIKHLNITQNTSVNKWNTRQWGEIPADFGRK